MSGHINVQLQPRDYAILSELLDSRVMTLAHVAALHFGGRGEAAKRRVWLLKRAGLIAEGRRKPFEPSVLSLGVPALAHLRRAIDSGHVMVPDAPLTAARAVVSPSMLRHELAVADAKVALLAGLNQEPDVVEATFETRPSRRRFTTRRRAVNGYGVEQVTVKPDGFLRFRQRLATDGSVHERYCFVEVDQGTEALHVLDLRAAAYREHWRQGGFAASMGADPSAYHEFPFRVLLVVRSVERRNNLAERLLLGHRPILTQVWLTTVAELTADPLGQIWVRPHDYRDAIVATPYESRRVDRVRRKRHPVTGAHPSEIEGRIVKQRILFTKAR